MRNIGTYAARTATLVLPLIRLADWSCMAVTGPNFQPDAGLIRKARV